MKRLGEILVSKGIISPEQMEMALQEAKRTREVLGKLLVRMNLITDEQLLQALAQQMDLQFFSSLKEIHVSTDVIRSVPAKLVWHYKFMPLELKDKLLRIAVSDPLAMWAMEDLRLQLGFEVERVLATEKEILDTIRQYYGIGAETVEQILKEKQKEGDEKGTTSSVQAADIEDLEKAAKVASVIKLVNQILSEAISRRSTDIHIENYRNKVRVRYRIDGVLYDVSVPDEIRYLHQAIVSRIKIISNLNVVEKRLPQDGRAIMKVQGKQIDMRISTIPSMYGENVVIRILPVHLLLGLKDLGLLPEDLKVMEELVNRPHGIIFLTGPTGSGKTTTLYAYLTKLNKESVKIITIEDPIEYELEGIMQIQVKPEINFTFANALRSILRHDPDIMMIGEVRDLETAELAIRTSLTGHLMFSTLHTNDAPSGITRLLDIGIKPYLVASSVNAFISQRLVRVICPNCRTEKKNNKLLPSYLKGIKVFYGKGCEKCGFIGYKGRVAIYEILVVDDSTRDLIIGKASSVVIKKRAKEKGFKSLLDAGIEKIRNGITTPDEVIRVVEI